MIGANKWDAVRSRQAAAGAIDDRLEISLAQMRGVPVSICRVCMAADSTR